MKKIFILIMLFALTATTVFSQRNKEQVVMPTSFWDNTFIGASVGSNWTPLDKGHAFFKNLGLLSSVKVGKYFTPVLGMKIQLTVGSTEHKRIYGNGQCVFDHSNLSFNGLMNLNNLINGYKGEPRLFEVVMTGGIGWYHTFGSGDRSKYEVGENGNYVFNTMSLNGGFEFNFNLGKDKAWQINIIPGYTYLTSKIAENGYVSTSVGFTYKFKNKSNKKRHFTRAKAVEYPVWDKMVNDLVDSKAENEKLKNELLDAKKNIVHDTVKIIEQSEVDYEFTNVISFNINSDKVDKIQIVNLHHIAKEMKNNKDMKITVKGYADKETGTKEYNEKLAKRRAENVKKILVDKFGIDENRIEIISLGSEEQIFEENDWNRVVIFRRK